MGGLEDLLEVLGPLIFLIIFGALQVLGKAMKNKQAEQQLPPRAERQAPDLGRGNTSDPFAQDRQPRRPQWIDDLLGEEAAKEPDPYGHREKARRRVSTALEVEKPRERPRRTARSEPTPATALPHLAVEENEALIARQREATQRMLHKAERMRQRVAQRLEGGHLPVEVKSATRSPSLRRPRPSSLVRGLRSLRGLRQAILAREILGPPMGLDQGQGGHERR